MKKRKGERDTKVSSLQDRKNMRGDMDRWEDGRRKGLRVIEK